MNSAKTTLLLSRIILIGKGYLITQASSTLLAPRSVVASGTKHISIQPVAIAYIIYNQMSSSFLPFTAYIMPPLIRAIQCLQISPISYIPISNLYGW